MTDAHDTIETVLIDIIPPDGIDDRYGVTHTQCSIALQIERALTAAGHLEEK